MGVMNDNDRREVWKDFMADASNVREPLDLTKADLRAAVDGLDVWLNSNAASANQAIPPAARGQLTTSQKAKLLMYVIRRRFVSGA